MSTARNMLNSNSVMDDSAILKQLGYITGRDLGEGSYAKVKSAYSQRLNCNVAVKTIDRKKAPHDFLKRFLPREMEILLVMNHQSVVKTYEIINMKGGNIYIIMELAVQGDLLEFIKSRGAIKEEVACKLFHQLLIGVKYCHDLGIVHRDLKCENILLDKNFNIKLSDFGFGRRISHDEAGKTVLSNTFCGTAAYAAPEVLQGIPYNPKVYDIWSLGIILFVMVFGSMPFKDTNIKKMLRQQKEHKLNFPHYKHLSSSCKDLIYCILQPDVSRRPTINEILKHTWFKVATSHQSPENHSNEVMSKDQASVLKQVTASTEKQSATYAANFQGDLQQEQASTNINKACALSNSGIVVCEVLDA